MDNQHKQIKGYRDLNQYEIDLMNRIKAHAEQTGELATEVKNYITQQGVTALQECGQDELDRLMAADPEGVHQEATMKLKTGFMLMVRSVAQPTTF